MSLSTHTQGPIGPIDRNRPGRCSRCTTLATLNTSNILERMMTAVRYTPDPTSSGLPLRDRLCTAAIEHFGRFGFDQSMLDMSIAADVDVTTLEEFFGSIDGLRAACDEYLMNSIRDDKTRALTSTDSRDWFSQLANIDSYAPMLSYLVRSLQEGDPAGHSLLGRMTANAEQYLEAGVRADYARDLIIPALELYTYGLLADDTMYQAFIANAPAS